MAPSHGNPVSGDKDIEMSDAPQPEANQEKTQAIVPGTNDPGKTLDLKIPSPPDPSTVSVNAHDHSQDSDTENDSEDVTETEQFILNEINRKEVRIFNGAPILRSLKRKNELRCEMGDECPTGGIIAYDKGDGLCGECRKTLRQETAKMIKQRGKKIEFQAQLYQSFVGRIRNAAYITNRTIEQRMARAQEDVNQMHQIRSNMRYNERDLLQVYNQSGPNYR